MKTILVMMMNPAFDITLEVDSFLPGATNRVLKKNQHAAGKGMNVALVARRFYEDVTVLGFCPEADKKPYEEALLQAGIDRELLPVSGRVRSNIKIYDRQRGVTTELNEAGFSVSKESCSLLLERYAARLDDACVVVLTGSLPKCAPQDFYATCAYLAAQKGVPVVLDAEGDPFLHGLKAGVYAVKPNEEELSKFAGKTLKREAEILEAMSRLKKAGVSLAVASFGKKGACFMQENATIFTSCPKVEVKSTVGAGDSMVALIACGIAEAQPLSQMAALATAAGSVTASCEGTDLCDKETVIEKSREVTLRYVDQIK
ncbi:MAG: 1-phosphofructokinase family hexose kinase [Ruminococcaceae bacterium]|nr:1-phosphofructokinase family hexose kinase [Oscillospiraceae bacterium]